MLKERITPRRCYRELETENIEQSGTVLLIDSEIEQGKERRSKQFFYSVRDNAEFRSARSTTSENKLISNVVAQYVAHAHHARLVSLISLCTAAFHYARLCSKFSNTSNRIRSTRGRRHTRNLRIMLVPLISRSCISTTE